MGYITALDLHNSTGIYIIYVPHNNSIYVGSTTQSYKVRFLAHRKCMVKGKHINQRIQNIYNKHGIGVFDFIPLDIVRGDDLEYIYDIEQDWINYFRLNTNMQVLNLSSVIANNYTDPLRIEKIRIAKTKNTYNGLVGPDKVVYNNITNLKEFAERHGMKFADLHQVFIGKRKSCNGWHLIGNEDYRKTPIYAFVSPDGIVFQNITNLKMFCKKHNLLDSKMCIVWSEKRKSHKGWLKDFSFTVTYRDVRYNTDKVSYEIS